MIHKQHCNIYIASCDEQGGIFHYNFDSKGNLKLLEKYNLDRPMYLTIDNNKMFAILRSPFSDSKNSGLVTFDIDNNGKLNNKNKCVSTKGEVACHLAVKNNDIYCVNYISGSVIKMPDNLVLHKGVGVHPVRQTSPHTHGVFLSPDGKYVLVTDLGLDTIFIYDRDLKEIFKAKVPDGYGVRHMVFSKCEKYLYCINELNFSISIFRYKEGNLTYVKTINCQTNNNSGAAIRISNNGKYLYVSNRGDNSITVFKILKEDLKQIQKINCEGDSPRDFILSKNNKYLLCANENSNNVIVFLVNNGIVIKKVDIINVEKPLCIII